MASAQWKNFQPSNQDGAMSAYQRSSSFSKQSNNSNNVSSSSNSSGPLRETGIIEKLLHSYGFIQCCEKQARLFFHFSQFGGNIDYLKVGDAVEFETTYDRKTGKPIAREVVKISPESLSDEVLSEERVSGLVTTEIKNGNEGRIAYENRGECFFLPYCNDDVDFGNSDEVHFQSGDKVTFLISPDKQTGNPRARNVRLERPLPEKFQGCINSLKETFGFIERADVVKEIFFHASECKDFKNLNLGDDVAFNIQTRNNKEVATNVVCLPTGTVIFEDISSEAVMGQVIKSIDRYQSRQASTELPGRIRYRRDNNRENEIQFGEKDTKGDFTLQNGDWVQFNMAVDRRDKLQRATNIDLLDESFIVSGEKREQGVIAAIKDTYGFITYGPPSQNKRNNRGDSSNRYFFRFSELLDPEQDLKLSDEVEFTVVQDPASPSRYHAVRIRNLPPGTIIAETHSYNNSSNHDERSYGMSKKLVGKIEKKPSKPNKIKQRKSNSFGQGSNSEEDDNSLNGDEAANGFSDGYDGVITYNSNGETLTAAYSRKDYDRKNKPRVGDKVEFVIETDNNQDYAREVRLLGPHAVRNGFRFTHRGFIAALKDSFGFIETEEHDREIFFHFNVYDGNPSQLDLGQEVEYGISNKGVKVSAEAVRKIQQGTIPQPEFKTEILNGVVSRPVRCFNPEQDEYAGLITLTLDTLPDLTEELVNGEDDVSESNSYENRPEYEFGITSLDDKHDFLQKGDAVQFQIGMYKIDGEMKERAVKIKAIRTKLQANVEAIHGNFGFLSHEVEDGKKLFFHMSEVKGSDILQTGDRVEFVLMHNQRTGKHSACSVVKIGDVAPTQRPERLLNRLRTVSMDEGPKVIVIRQPKGPDGSGFKTTRSNSVSSNQAPNSSSNGICASIKNQEILLNGDEHANTGLNVEAPIFGMNNEQPALPCDTINSFECQHNQQISA